MSLSQLIKDYIDTINSFYDSFYGDIDVTFMLKFLTFYLSESIKLIFQYIWNFRWLSDFYSFKIAIPQLIDSNLVELYSLQNYKSYLFSFFRNPNFIPDVFIFGLVNSLILSLPFSSSHILWLRRLTVEGVLSGMISGLGIILSQFLLNISVLIGFRFVIFPWFSFEGLNYIIGLVLTFRVIFATANRPTIRIKYYQRTQLVKIFILHFILTWTEQSTLFQYLTNLSFNPEATLFEVLGPDHGIYSDLLNWSYLSGLFFGSILWTTFFGWGFLSIGYSSSRFFKFPYSYWVRYLHYSSLVLLIAFNITSFPYYNLDYLVSSNLGFVSQDDALKNTQLRVNSRDLRKGRLGEYSSHTSLDTDISIFDRARYQSSSEVELTFEDLNYQGEYVWRSRNDRIASGSGGIVNKLIKKFLPRFKKIKKKFLQTKELKENLRAAKVGINLDKFSNKLSLDEPSTDSYIPGSLLSTESEGLIRRFIGDYQSEVVRSNLPEPYNQVEPDSYSAFSELVRYGFDGFSGFEERESDEFEQRLGKRIKLKYYLNPVYRSILGTEVSSFLRRQPKRYSLTPKEENDLFRNRLVLANYYDSLRAYSKIPYIEAFSELFTGPKSYANRVYNQQFKGTLKIVRRLFSISLERRRNPNNESILKFDQPLYKDKLVEKSALLHEELNYNSTVSVDQNPFLKEANSIPFYAGWDERFRRFLVTNYWLSYSETGMKMDYPDILNNQDLNPNFNRKKINRKAKNIRFITWPLSKAKIETLKDNSKVSATLMFSSYDDPANVLQRDIFEYAEPEDYEIRLIYDTLPSLLRRVDLRDKEKAKIYLKPLRGGIMWRGGETTKLKFQEAQEILTKYIRDWRDSNP